MSDTAAHSELAWDLVDRLHKALRIGKCKPGEMKNILGVSPATMTNYLSGKTRPKDGMLRQWGMRCGVPFDWLRYGIEADDTGPGAPSDLPGRSSPCMTDNVIALRGVEWGGRSAVAA